MNTSLSWMKMYVPDLDVTAQEYTDAMTLSGTKVEGFTRLDADLEKIVIGQIEKIGTVGYAFESNFGVYPLAVSVKIALTSIF